MDFVKSSRSGNNFPFCLINIAKKKPASNKTVCATWNKRIIYRRKDLNFISDQMLRKQKWLSNEAQKTFEQTISVSHVESKDVIDRKMFWPA